MREKYFKLERVLRLFYKTPNRISWVVFLFVHLGLTITQFIVGGNYLLLKFNQFIRYPITTSFEMLIPYLVTYIGNSIGRRLN